MEQQQNGRTPPRPADPEDLGRSFEGQGLPSYGGDLGVSFEQHNSSPELRVDPSRRRGRTWIWITAIVAVAIAVVLIIRLTHPAGGADAAGAKGGAAAGGAAGAGGHGRGQTGPAAITVGQSQTGDINIYDDALGTVTPLYTVTLYSQITGKVMAVHYREGQIVHKGEPLVDIDPRPYQATLAQAEGTLTHDQGVLAQARVDLERYRAAYARNAIAKQQLDDQEQIVIQDQGTVEADQGTVQYDQVQLSYCHITAPITGRVGLRLVDPGNTVFSGSSSTLAVITQLQPITVVFNVSEDDLPQVQAQLKATKTLEVDAYDRSDSKEIEKGKLTSLDNQIDTTTGTLKFRATFQNKNYELFPNQFVNARLLVKTLKNTVLVPTAAVQHNGTAAFVYTVAESAPGQPAPDQQQEKAQQAGGGSKDGAKGGSKGAPEKPAGPKTTVHVQPVNVLTSNEKETAVEGIGAGVTLATSGFDRLENGAEVMVHQPGPKKSPGDSANPSSSSSSSPTSGHTAP
jgi:multidrug efflux system membrane fusion protein